MELNWSFYTLNPYDGYGRWGAHFIRELSRKGVGISPIHRPSLKEMPGWIQQLAGIDFTKLTIACMTADQFPNIPGRLWGFTMCEGTRVTSKWVSNINTTCERLLVPCEQNVQAFKDSGVTVPIHIVPGGTSPAEFPMITRPEGRPYTFLVLGDRGVRKGLETVWTAFHKAFGGDPSRFGGNQDVRLLIKSRPRFAKNFDVLRLADRRIAVWRQEVDDMADVYSSIDCFVFPSRGEGWGMPPREAAMMGLPVIATRWGGLEEGIDHWGIPLEHFTMGPADLEYGDGAQWAIPSVDEVADKMLWCYEHQEDARVLGRNASIWLRTHQTWGHAVDRLLELLERYG